MNRKIALVSGGDSSEREISLRTALSVEKALIELGYDYSIIEFDKEMASKIADYSPDIVFIALHGGKGEDGSVQGFFESVGIPYTGSGVFSSALCMNKAASKILFASAGLYTPKWQVIKSAEELELELPVVIKPVCGGSTVAASIVKSFEELTGAIFLAEKEYGAAVMAEEYIVGKEITVSVLDGEALPPLEIIAPSGFFDYSAKYYSGSKTHKLFYSNDERFMSRIKEDSEKAYRIAECSGAARVDYIIYDNRLSILEINTLPGMTSTSLLPDAALAGGINFNELVQRIIDCAVPK